MIDSFFWVFGKDGPELGVAYLRPDVSSDLYPHIGRVRKWKQITLDLKDGEFTDYLSSDLVCSLCSEKMRLVIEPYVKDRTEIQWLDVLVEGNGLISKYSVLHISDVADVLDPIRTVFVRDGKSMTKPFLDLKKIGDRAVFRLRPFGTDLVVSGRIRDALIKSKCTGLEFTPIAYG